MHLKRLFLTKSRFSSAVMIVVHSDLGRCICVTYLLWVAAFAGFVTRNRTDYINSPKLFKRLS